MSYSEIHVIVPLKLSNFSSRQNDEDISNFLHLLESIIRELQKNMKISYPIWSVDLANNFKEVRFYTQKDNGHFDEILALLSENGFGSKVNSAISIRPLTNLIFETEENFTTAGEEPNLHELSPKSTNDGWNRFVHSLEPIVAELFETIRRQATLKLDFILLLIVAALTASIGLIENSTVILVASMLISPMMGPVMAVMFGTLTGTRKLQKLGIANTLLTVLFCVITGFFFGFAFSLLEIRWPEIGLLPTYEMYSRGGLRSLWIGTCTAFLSGVAIAAATLNDRWRNSITGVTISVSLLPPAVNAGLLWSMAVVNSIHQLYNKFPKKYKVVWSEQPGMEYASLGGISLCLTFINIICIFIGGAIILKIKKFRIKQNEQLFSRSDFNIGNDYNNIIEDIKIFNERPNFDELRLNRCRWSFSHWQEFPEMISHRNLHTWTPTTANTRWNFDGRPNIQDLSVLLSQERVTNSSHKGEHKRQGMPILTEQVTENNRFIVTQTKE